MAAYDNDLTRIVAELNSAALLIIAGAPIALRIDGKLTIEEGPPVEPDEASQLLVPVLTPKQYEELQKNKSVDFCFSREGIGRFRANLHHQRGTLAASLRLLPARIPSLESLRLPMNLHKLAEIRKGLVLITGSTGSGKSSTIAALIDLINSQRRDHVITV